MCELYDGPMGGTIGAGLRVRTVTMKASKDSRHAAGHVL
jgi:hypothetical protein